MGCGMGTLVWSSGLRVTAETLNRITRAALVQGVRGERTSARGHAPRRDEGCRGWRAIAVSFSIVLVLSELEVLQDVCARLERSRIAYMLTGSMAMNYYAQPRMTRDIDIVVELERMSADALATAFEPEYYVPLEAVADAIAQRGMFNLLHLDSVVKIGRAHV